MTRQSRPGRARLLWKALSLLLAFTVTAAAAALVLVPKLGGAVPLTVLTGSMRPAYPPGSVVVVRPVPAEELQIGDVITYQLRPGDPEVVTHRIVAVGFGTDGRREFVTRGDANGAADPDPVIEEQVRGEVWYAVPFVGHLLNAMTPQLRELARVAISTALILNAVLTIGQGVAQHRRRHSALAPAS